MPQGMLIQAPGLSNHEAHRVIPNQGSCKPQPWQTFSLHQGFQHWVVFPGAGSSDGPQDSRCLEQLLVALQHRAWGRWTQLIAQSINNQKGYNKVLIGCIRFDHGCLWINRDLDRPWVPLNGQKSCLLQCKSSATEKPLQITFIFPQVPNPQAIFCKTYWKRLKYIKLTLWGAYYI